MVLPVDLLPIATVDKAGLVWAQYRKINVEFPAAPPVFTIRAAPHSPPSPVCELGPQSTVLY